MRREGNTLSPLLRSAWDCNVLEVMTRSKSKLRASNAFISILAHITPNELKRLFGESIETSNGFANRFLWCLVESTKSLPHGGNVLVLEPFVARLKQRLEHAQTIQNVGESEGHRILWELVYPSLRESKGGTATDRARPQVLRLTLLFCLLDGSPKREEKHLKAALAVWHYCEESARILFTNEKQSQEEHGHERKLLELVKAKPGIMRSELRSSLSHRVKTAQFDSCLLRLLNAGRIIMVPVFGSRHADCFYVGMGTGYTAKATTKAFEPTSPKSPLPSTDTTPTKAVEPAYPISPLRVSANTNTKAASLMELMNWRNQNSVIFAWSEEHSSYWVIPQDEHKLTPAIAAALREQQVFVQAIAGSSVLPTNTNTPTLLPTNDTPSREMSEEEFFSSLREACLGKK